MLRVGLTGSIGVGKSFVAGVLAELGCYVLDADQTARSVVEKGSKGLAAVVAAFGPKVLRDDGTLDRQGLSSIIFADQEKRELLNSILHPHIIEAQNQQLDQWQASDPDSIAVVDAALMIESGSYKRFDKLIVVYCRPEVQLQRIMVRDGISLAAAQLRVRSQMSQEEKRRFADFLIDTSEGFADTRRRTEEVHKQLVRLPKNKTTAC